MAKHSAVPEIWRNIDKKILYIDLDDTLVDFQSGVDRLPDHIRRRYDGGLDNAPGIFALMEPIAGAVEAFSALAEAFDTYILSVAPWNNPNAWSHKLEWVREHLGYGPNATAHERLILTHHKSLNMGDYLVDDRVARGADRFSGELIHFGQGEFSDWPAVTEYLLARA